MTEPAVVDGDTERARELFSDTEIPACRGLIVRLDGRGFSRLTETSYRKPFDREFMILMGGVAEALVTELGGVLAYVQSDEVSVVLPPRFDLFRRRHEKLISVAAGIASAEFSRSAETLAHFDARVWVGDRDDVPGYLLWRQYDCERNALNSAAYWAQRQEGASARAASAALRGATRARKVEIILDHGAYYDQLPTWARRGTVWHWITYTKPAVDPLTNQRLHVERCRLIDEVEVPAGPEFQAWATARLHEDERWTDA